jgi:leader peptidase (prepilin peptidase) / N-methyltransferase
VGRGVAMIFGFLVLSITLLAISVIDARTRRIPDWLSLPLIATGMVWSHRYGALPFPDYVFGCVGGFASLWLFGSVYFNLRGREGLGMGDAKLFAAAGAWLGWQALPLVLLAAALGGLTFAVARGVLFGRPTAREIAFGPWIAAAFWTLWVAGQTLAA